MGLYKEINFCGIFLAPFFLCLLIAGVFAVASPGRVLNKSLATSLHPVVVSDAAR